MTAVLANLQFRRISANDWLRLALGGVGIGLIFYAYFIQVVDSFGLTTYTWLRAHWNNISHYSHGPLIPAIALGLLWWKRGELAGLTVVPLKRGVAVVAFAMFLYYAGVRAEQERVVVISFVVLLYGLALALGGRELFRVVFFPISFLLLMVPLNFLEERVALPLRHLMAGSATATLNAIGIETVRSGTGIFSDVFKFDVANPCSGIQSLMALTTVTAAYGYVTQASQWKRWFLFLCAMPLAVLGNYVRVVGIALVAQNFGTKTAMELHDTIAGFVVFAVALAAMVAVGWLLNQPYRQLWLQWTRPLEPTGKTA